MSLVEAPHRRAAMTGGGAPWTWRGGARTVGAPAVSCFACCCDVRERKTGRRRDEKEKKRSAGKKRNGKRENFPNLKISRKKNKR
jgi:ribosomal protein L21